MTDTKKKIIRRTELTLKKKVDVVNYYEKTGDSYRWIGKKFNISKSQVVNILKRKRDLLHAYEEDGENQRKRIRVCLNGHDWLNEWIWMWFQRQSSQNVQVSGSMCREQALLYAKQLGLDNFKGSNGWLDSFRRRHNISFSAKKCVTNSRVVTDTSDSIAVSQRTSACREKCFKTSLNLPPAVLKMENAGIKAPIKRPMHWKKELVQKFLKSIELSENKK